MLRAADPAHRYLCTLDDVSQCSYTSGHASQDERLYLDHPEDMDWDDPAQEQALRWLRCSTGWRSCSGLSSCRTGHRSAARCCWLLEDVDALLQANRSPEARSTRWSTSRRLPVPSDELNDRGPAQNGLFQRGLGQSSITMPYICHLAGAIRLSLLRHGRRMDGVCALQPARRQRWSSG